MLEKEAENEDANIFEEAKLKVFPLLQRAGLRLGPELDTDSPRSTSHSNVLESVLRKQNEAIQQTSDQQMGLTYEEGPS